jgi:Bacterial hydrolase
MKTPYPSETGCCPRFLPEPWQERELQWDQKLFLKDRVRCFFFMPLNFGRVISRDLERIGQAGACPSEAPLVLSDHTSRWNTDLYVEVTKELPGADHARLSGSFVSKVFEGPYRDAGQWRQQMHEWVRSKGKVVKREFMYYTTCPKCAQHYGKNYVVILAEV